MDVKLKIRQAKRSKDKALDLSNLELREIPVDIQQLTMLESLNISNNKLTSLKRVEDLPNLREINASNNQIKELHSELQDMYCLETLILIGNPVVN
jgi:internalin A